LVFTIGLVASVKCAERLEMQNMIGQKIVKNVLYAVKRETISISGTDVNAQYVENGETISISGMDVNAQYAVIYWTVRMTGKKIVKNVLYAVKRETINISGTDVNAQYVENGETTSISGTDVNAQFAAEYWPVRMNGQGEYAINADL